MEFSRCGSTSYSTKTARVCLSDRGSVLARGACVGRSRNRLLGTTCKDLPRGQAERTSHPRADRTAEDHLGADTPAAVVGVSARLARLGLRVSSNSPLFSRSCPTRRMCSNLCLPCLCPPSSIGTTGWCGQATTPRSRRRRMNGLVSPWRAWRRWQKPGALTKKCARRTRHGHRPACRR